MHAALPVGRLCTDQLARLCIVIMGVGRYKTLVTDLRYSHVTDVCFAHILGNYINTLELCHYFQAIIQNYTITLN